MSNPFGPPRVFGFKIQEVRASRNRKLGPAKTKDQAPPPRSPGTNAWVTESRSSSSGSRQTRPWARDRRARPLRATSPRHFSRCAVRDPELGSRWNAIVCPSVVLRFAPRVAPAPRTRTRRGTPLASLPLRANLVSWRQERVG